jgi:hypothetical protein
MTFTTIALAISAVLISYAVLAKRKAARSVKENSTEA